MAFGLPAFFGSKARSRVPLGIDVTTITDISGSMGQYAEFITTPLLYQALETALTAENIGTAAGQTNRYSFCIGGDMDVTYPPLDFIERFVEVNGNFQRWALGSDVLGLKVAYPYYDVGGAGTENMAGSTNRVSALAVTNPREYILSNERIIISGSDEQDGQGNVLFDQSPGFSYRYVGIHSAILSISEAPNLPPDPGGTLVGFVYTTASQGVAVYLDGSTISYRTDMPTSTFIAAPTALTAQICVDQCRITNGALYDIRAFNSAARYALLGESLGSVLGKYLYSVS